jgi:hypothetical protein
MAGDVGYIEIRSFPFRPASASPDDDADETMVLERAIVGVVFEGFTREGRKEYAIHVASIWNGYQIQERRILSLVEAALEEVHRGPEMALEKLKERANALSTVAERALIDNSAARLQLTEADRVSLIKEMEHYLTDSKTGFLNQIKSYERLAAPAGVRLENELTLWKKRYEIMLQKWRT